MQTQEQTDIMTQEVIEGLKAQPKYILSKYFYDDKGSELFTQIMHMPEYYLTDSELNIFKRYSRQIVNSLLVDSRPVNLVELGAGDGLKTRLLVQALMNQGVAFSYVPVDISEEAIVQLQSKFKKEFPGLEIDGKIKDYEAGLGDLQHDSSSQNVVLFLGSTIGNFERKEAVDFLQMINQKLKKDDILLIGFDLVKDPDIILKAYNDKQGITRRFNLNLLERFNRELGADFDISNFRHYPLYDPLSKAAKSFLLSEKDQDVFFEALDETIHFDKWEFIFTEISRKFDLPTVNRLSKDAGFSVYRNFANEAHYFIDSLWKKLE
ncbi:MAG: L-histidine N(alpha)-methyltransferase [Bacteroidales bacterium]|nr:L-histidine N(alpha)-methyltransferase [Bacteroidales bacterium]MCF8334546.1 L-histidine N(alpha)-methyltransferase [Bacteroidales bacterium]